jgi:membrane-bound metal-dependent hydrolase YbcI (DUF457 family)
VLGRDHALLGAVGWVGLAPLVAPQFAHTTLSPAEIGIGGVVSAAFALVPDIDEPGSTVSRKLGPISEAVSHLTKALAGGHRKATHSLLFVGAVGVATVIAAHYMIAPAVIVGLSFLLVFRMLVPRMFRFLPLVSLGMVGLAGLSAWWIFRHSGMEGWLPYACAGGILWHMIGDTLTVEGVPYFWLPGVKRLQDARIAVPLVGHCGSVRETFLGWVMGLGLLWMSAILVLLPLVHSTWPTIKLPAT